MSIDKTVIKNNLTHEQFNDLVKVAKDVFFFFTFLFVIHPIRGKTQFDLYPFQKRTLWYFLTKRFNIVLKFRQAGVTELIAGYCLWLAMYQPNKSIVIISIKDRVAKKVLRKIKYMYRNLSEHLKVKVVNGRPGEIGCITEDTKIVGLNGDFEIGTITPKTKGIQDVSHLDIKVLTHEGTFEKILTTINKGVLETYKILNNRGKIIRCTYNHKLYTIDGWKKVDEILESNLTCIFWDSSYLEGIQPPITIPPTREVIKETQYLGYYVSNLGDVYTKNFLKRKAPDKLYKMTLRDQGHLRARFKVGGKGKFIAVHRLVWETFEGPIPKDKIIDHINCNRKDNYLTNLQCITKGENIKRAFKYNRSMKNMNYRLTALSLKNLGKIKDIDNTEIGYGSGRNIADELGISTKEVSRYRRGIAASHIYTSKIELINTTQEVIVDMEVENSHSYIAKSEYINHNTAQEIEFSNGSVISSVPTTEEAGRSEALSLLVIDEAAIIRWANTIWASAFPTLSTGGAAIVNSTPYGLGNWFHSEWVKAVSGGSEFNPIRLRWQMHPERDQAWYDTMSAALGPKRTAQEIDGDFLTSGNSVFDLIDIRAIEDSLDEFPVIKTLLNGSLLLFGEPKRNERYFIGGDIATGRSRHYSAFTIYDQGGEEWGVFKKKIPVGKFADLLMKMGKEWNNASLAPESNDIGLAVTTKIEEAGYRNLFYSTKFLRKKGKKRTEEMDIPGWYTTNKNRPVIIDGLEEDIRLNNIIVKDPFFVQEAYTFIYDERNKPVAMGKNSRGGDEDDLSEGQDYNDDSILGKAIANQIRKGKIKGSMVLPR